MPITDSAARVLTAVDELAGEGVELLADLVRIPSIGGTDAEHDIQAHLAALLHADGLAVDHWRVPVEELAARPGFPGMEVPRSEAWGLVGRLPGRGGGPSLLLDAHVDVVPPGDRAQWPVDPFAAEIHGGVLRGRGACDMKAGLVSALLAMRALRRARVTPAGDVLLACVQGEEDGGLGTFALLDRGYRADACVVPEPTGLDVVPANAGALTFRLRVPGRATHAARRLDGVSALDAFWPVHRALAELERRRNQDVDPLAAHWPLPYPLSIGAVRAGDWASSVPDLLVAEGRLGVALDEPVDAARAALEDAVAGACSADPWLRDHPATVEWWGGQFAAGRGDPDGALTAAVRAAHHHTAGGDPAVWAAPYGSDLRLLAGAGIRTVQYGPGDAGVAHGPDEHVALADVQAAARTLALLALDLCGAPTGR